MAPARPRCPGKQASSQLPSKGSSQLLTHTLFRSRPGTQCSLLSSYSRKGLEKYSATPGILRRQELAAVLPSEPTLKLKNIDVCGREDGASSYQRIPVRCVSLAACPKGLTPRRTISTAPNFPEAPFTIHHRSQMVFEFSGRSARKGSHCQTESLTLRKGCVTGAWSRSHVPYVQEPAVKGIRK